MNSIEIEPDRDKPDVRRSLTQWLLEKAQSWINSLLAAELDDHLERKRYAPVPADEVEPNYRNGFRPRQLNLLGLGVLRLRVPRDRRGTFRSRLLPERKAQDEAFEAFVAECFLAGLSTRDITRLSAKHLGKRYDSKQVSRIVGRATAELEAWQQRSLAKIRCKFLFVDGANFRVRINHRVSRQSFCAVLGISEESQTYEVLGLTMGDRERSDLWADVFADLVRRGLDPTAVELGIMDGLPGLEDTFRRCFPRAQTQRCQVHAKRNALRRVRKADRPAFSAGLSRVFYAGSASEARQQFHAFQEQWQPHFPGAVAVIERDLDSLLRFFEFDPTYWATIRTTNPIERLNKEFKRRTRAMEVTGGEASTYRILSYVAMTMEYQWSFHQVTRWAHAYPHFSGIYTHDAA
jgi:putative transposase